MKINNHKKVKLIISLLDSHILNELKKKEFNEDRIQTITGIRSDYIEELNSVQRGENIQDMFDKNYFKNFRKS